MITILLFVTEFSATLFPKCSFFLFRIVCFYSALIVIAMAVALHVCVFSLPGCLRGS